MQTISGVLLCSLLLYFSLDAFAGNPEAEWIDSVSFSYGVTEDSDSTEAFRIGIQNTWERSWFRGGAWYLSGYWDAALTWMDNNESNESLWAVSLTPTLRLQRDDGLSGSFVPFAEAGLGAHLLTDTQIGDAEMSTAFQLGSLAGFGARFGEKHRYEIAYRFQHISNSDIKIPNDGIDLHLLRLGYNFF